MYITELLYNRHFETKFFGQFCCNIEVFVQLDLLGQKYLSLLCFPIVFLIQSLLRKFHCNNKYLGSYYYNRGTEHNILSTGTKIATGLLATRYLTIW